MAPFSVLITESNLKSGLEVNSYYKNGPNSWLKSTLVSLL